MTNQWTWVTLSGQHTLDTSLIEPLLLLDKACGRELTKCLRIICGPKNCSGPALLVIVEAPRSRVMRVSTFSPFPNVGQTWTIVCQPDTLCQRRTTHRPLPFAYHFSFPNVGHTIYVCYFIVSGKNEALLKISIAISCCPITFWFIVTKDTSTTCKTQLAYHAHTFLMNIILPHTKVLADKKFLPCSKQCYNTGTDCANSSYLTFVTIFPTQCKFCHSSDKRL